MVADNEAYTGNESKPGNSEGQTRGRSTITRGGIFAYDLLLLALFTFLGWWYVKFPESFSFAADPYRLTMESMWFGLLGGVIISLKGIYDHSSGSDPWDPSFNLWHLGRPVSGAIAGLVTVVLLKVVNNGDLARPVVFAAAFIFGTQERRFFNFLYEVARLIVQVPQETTPDLSIADVQPAEGASGAVIVVRGQGIQPNATLRLGGSAVEKVVISSDGTAAAGLIPTPAAGSDTVDVIVTNPSGSTATLPGKFRFSNQQLLSKRGLATADFKAQVADSGNCTDRIWLKSIINPILADQIAVPLSKLDPTKKFADYKIGFPQFLQLCSDITGLINTKLENEPCKQRLARPSPDWCTQHQNDTIGAFVDAVVDQILTPAAGAVG